MESLQLFPGNHQKIRLKNLPILQKITYFAPLSRNRCQRRVT
ncbi:hypothetical protein BACCOPRO_03587 [Phocaeicola coprophilus DSM 18228 = JCM 13818]|uniref:Uncharacterized protein n=1 Tax=Phocaeicola coprophilus DSM 18228 = JCM 13818 TaxID=547042 RepID=S0FCQ8_9BACT|nr:hypothetical protein BACCOPRO_03587 [Phocaeicola coprophilus DSM 18228 = JCM 13818]